MSRPMPSFFVQSRYSIAISPAGVCPPLLCPKYSRRNCDRQDEHPGLQEAGVLYSCGKYDILKEPGLRLPAAISRLERRSCPAGRCPNSSSLHPPQAAVVAVALFSRFSHLLLRSRLYALAGREVLLKRNTIGGAENRRSTKNAFSEAASIFVLRQLLRGLKGASSPFLVPPAPRK